MIIVSINTYKYINSTSAVSFSKDIVSTPGECYLVNRRCQIPSCHLG